MADTQEAPDNSSSRSGGEPKAATRPGRPLSSLAGSLASDMAFPGIEEEKAAVHSLRVAPVARKYCVF
jgi:hypothetical protein